MCQFADVVLKTQEILVDLLIQFLVDSIHVLLVPLIIFRPLALHLLDVIAILSNVNIMRGALHSQIIDLVAELVDVTLLLTTGALQTADAQIKGVEALGCFLRDVGVMPLNTISTVIDLLVHVLILFPQVRLDLVRLGIKVVVCSVDFEIEVPLNLSMFLGRVFQSIAMVMALINSLVQNLVVIVHEYKNHLSLVLSLFIQGLDATADLAQCFINLASAAIHLQAQR